LLRLLVFLILFLLLILWVKNLRKIYSGKYYQTGRLILIVSFLRFVVLKIFFFFILFEFSVLPIFLIILGWGYQPERVLARKLIIFYTFTLSIPLLLIFLWWERRGVKYFTQINPPWGGGELENIFILFLLLSILVKLPMFFLHLWLPQAHVEAPVEGSIILAAVLLKLGGYGLYRLRSLFSHELIRGKLLFIICLVGGRVSTFLCVQQVDLKVIIAYSSVGHIALVISAILTDRVWGKIRAIIILFRHGFISSGIFFIVGHVYERSGSRRTLLNKGILLYRPIFSQIWFLMCLRNIAAPPRRGLIGEIFGFIALAVFIKLTIGILRAYLLLAVFYNLNLYNILNHGPGGRKNSFLNLDQGNILVVIYHIFFSFLLIFLVKLFFL